MRKYKESIHIEFPPTCFVGVPPTSESNANLMKHCLLSM